MTESDLRLVPPNGHYSAAVEAGGFLFLAMQLPIDGNGGGLPAGSKAQARQAIRNCEAVLSAAGSSLEDVVSATVYLTDIGDWEVIDQAFAEMFGDNRPARAVVMVSGLHLGAAVGVQVTAAPAKSMRRA